jgi:citrate/tricarballylate utilization protein
LEPTVQQLEALIHEAEAERVLMICNACRYCEGFCAVFPAMARRLEFPKADIHYLANLCHNCGACLHACQYADPHEFKVNVPAAMAKVRAKTYADYAWPAGMGKLYERNGLTLAMALAAGLALFLVLCVSLNGYFWHAPMAGNFYAVFPHGLMVSLFAPVFLFACLALALGVASFWRDVAPGSASRVGPGSASHAARGEALKYVLQLKYLDGGHGQGCNEEDDAFTLWRRRFHHATFYGFMLCFAATCVATLYHYLGWAHWAGWACWWGRWAWPGCTTSATPRMWSPRKRRWTKASSRCSSSQASPAWRCWRCAARVPWPCCWRCTWVL